jgi:hypothetical protein
MRDSSPGDCLVQKRLLISDPKYVYLYRSAEEEKRHMPPRRGDSLESIRHTPCAVASRFIAITSGTRRVPDTFETASAARSASRLSANSQTIWILFRSDFFRLFQGKNLHVSTLLPATIYNPTEAVSGVYFRFQGVAKTATTPSQLDIFLTGECKRDNADPTLVLIRIHDKNLSQVLFSVVISLGNTNGGEG